jgi:hypothetical protein
MKYETFHYNLKIQLVAIFKGINAINVKCCVFANKKNDEVNNLWIKRIDEVDMLHAKIYYSYLMLVG